MPEDHFFGIDYLAFPAAVVFSLHSILTDPNLKNGYPDLPDGGKIFIEVCALLGNAAAAVRGRLRGRGLLPRRAWAVETATLAAREPTA